MATDKQIEANRLNAALSTGPKTPEGKATSSQNALKHGLRAPGFYCLSGEDPKHFNRLLTTLYAWHVPIGPDEKSLVRRICRHQIALERLDRIEDALLSAECDEEEVEKSSRSTAKLVQWMISRDEEREKLRLLLELRRDEMLEKREKRERLMKLVNPGMQPPAQMESAVPEVKTDNSDSEDESELIEVATIPTNDERIEAAAIMRMFEKHSSTMETLRRCRTSEMNLHYRAIHELERMQARRKGQSVIPPIVVDIISDSQK